MTQAVNVAALGSAGVSTGFKNKLINGDFKIWQRGTSFSAPSNGAATADRWFSTWGTANRTVSQQAGFNGAQYCVRVARNSGTADASYTGISQIIESSNIIPLQGQTVTVSFTARAGANFSAASNQLLFGIQTGSGIDQGYSSAWTASWTNNGYATTYVNGTSVGSVNLTTTATNYSFTTVLPANCSEAQLTFYFLSTGTAGASDYFEITNIQLEAGNTATNFESRPYGFELSLCQRYYFKKSSTNTAIEAFMLAGGGGTDLYGVYLLPVTMRVSPTATTSAASTFGTWPRAAGGSNVNMSGIYSIGSPSSVGNDHRVCEFLFTCSGTGTVERFGFKSTGYFALDAELN
jgi:hypothetical protein